MVSRAGAGASASLPSITIIVASLQCFAFLPRGNLSAASLPVLLQLSPIDWIALAPILGAMPPGG